MTNLYDSDPTGSFQGSEGSSLPPNVIPTYNMQTIDNRTGGNQIIGDERLTYRHPHGLGNSFEIGADMTPVLHPYLEQVGLHLDHPLIDGDQRLLFQLSKVAESTGPNGVRVALEIRAFNDTIGADMLKRSGLADYMNHRDPSHLPEPERESLELIYRGLAEQEAKVEAAMPILQTVHARYEQSDASVSLSEHLTPDERYENMVRERIKASGTQRIQLISDNDGTITTNNHRKEEDGSSAVVDTLAPGSAQFDPLYYGADHATFLELTPAATACMVGPIIQNHEDLYRKAGRILELREGAEDLGAYLETVHNTGITFVSAGFQPLTEEIASRIPGSKHEIHAIRPGDITSTRKDKKIETLIAKNPDVPVIYAGDGLSDMGVLKISGPDFNLFAGVCALKGSSFSRALRGAGIDHMEFETMHDVKSFLEKVCN